MSGRHTRAVAVLLAAMALASSARADVAEQVPVGVRAIAMGSAYTSLADDASALFWNPAGLPWLGHQELMGSQADLFGAGIRDHLAAFALPLSLRSAVGVDWYRSGFDDGELEFGENRIDLAVAYRARSWLSLGLTGKVLTQSASIDGGSLARGSGTGWDAGVLVTPADGVRLGLLARDVLDTRVRQDAGGTSAVLYPRTLRVGGSYGWGRLATVALDFDRRWHAGLEIAPIEAAAARIGYDDAGDDPDGPTLSYGVGVKAGVLRLDYAYVDHPVLAGTHHVSMALDFNFNPSQIRIERVQAHDVYASLYKSYARDTLATVQIRNLQDHSIEAQVGAFLPGMMEGPSRQTVLLRPNAVTPVPVRPVLAWRLLQSTGDHPVALQVSASYQSRRFLKTERAGARLVAYGPGAIDWSGGVGQAAAFVTPRDPVVEGLARAAAHAVTPADVARFGCRNIAFAAALFDALGQLKIAYVPDPNNPFSSISETPHAVDTVQYPGETLRKRTGDCDDTSVLMAALLASVGINTQLVDAPGHLFMIADTGLHERNRDALSLDSTRTIVRDEEVWIPIETTAIGRGFADAWRLGAESFANWSGRSEIDLADVAAAQATWEPADVVSDGTPPDLDAVELATRVAGDAAQVGGWIDEYRAARFHDTPELLAASPMALDRLAHVLYDAGQLDEAQARLAVAVAAAPGDVRLRQNLAAVLDARGLRDSALDQVDLALQLDPQDHQLWMARGVLLGEAGDSTLAVEAFRNGIRQAGGYDAATRQLRPAGMGAGDATSGLTVSARVRAALEAARAGGTNGPGNRGPAARRPHHPPASTAAAADAGTPMNWRE